MSWRASGIFRTFFVSYIFILIIPNISGYISYRVSIRQAESSAIETSLMLLGQTRAALERRMAEVEEFTKELALNQELTNLLYQNVEDTPGSIYALWKTWLNVTGYGKANDFLQDYFIYLKNSDLVLSPASMFVRPQHYYELNHYTGQSYEQWRETFQKYQQSTVIPLRSYTRNENETAVVTFVQSLPLHSFTGPQGAVAVIIDERKISSLLDSIAKQFGGWAFIADPDGHILANVGIDEARIQALKLSGTSTVGATHRFLDDESLLITTRSEINGWLYAAQIPRRALMEKAYIIRNVTWTVTAIAFLAGLIVCVLLAYRNSLPIHRLIGTIRKQRPESTPGKNEFDFLQGNISTLISNNERLEEERIRYLPLLKDAFVKELIRGEISSPGEIMIAASQTGIDLRGPYGFVGLIQINGYGEMDSREIFQEMNAARLIVKDVLHGFGYDFFYQTTDLESNKIAVLFTFPAEPGQSILGELETLLQQFHRQVEAEYRISITIAMGAIFHSLSDISRSYDEARQALEYGSFKAVGPTVWYDRLEKETPTYYYPIRLELRLLNAMKSGEWPEVKRITAEIFQRNFSERELSAEMAQQLIGELKGTMLKLFDQQIRLPGGAAEALRQRVVQIQSADSLAKVWGEMEGVMESLCGMIALGRSESINETVALILSHMEAMYGDAELTTYSIAEQVGRPERYISHLFKEQTGESIADGLEQIRIQKATNLLIETQMTMDDIAAKVGYNSAHSFRRAFKRVSGVSPSIYRTSSD